MDGGDSRDELTWRSEQLTQLTRIANALEMLVSLQLPPEPETPAPGCSHPLESRADFGTTNNQPDWLCRLCGYRSLTNP